MLNFRRKRVWVGIFALVIVVAFAAFRLAPRFGLRKEMEAWRRSGLPTNGMELHDWYTAVPSEKNAANLILEAYGVLVSPKSKPHPNSLELPNPGIPLPSEALAAIEEYVVRNKAALELLGEAAKFSESRYPCNLWMGFSTLLPHLAQVKELAQLLRLEAILHSSKGDRVQAVDAVRRGFALARSLRNEPTVVSDQVRVACVWIILRSLDRILSEHQLSSEEIAVLSSDLHAAEEDGRRGLLRGMAGERAIGAAALGSNFQEFIGLTGRAATPSPLEQLSGGSMFALYKASGLHQRDIRVYLETMNSFIYAATNEFPAALQKISRAEKEMDARLKTGLGRFAIMSRMLLPALSNAYNKEAVLTAKIRATRLALMVEAHRAKNAALPAGLEEILGEIPNDPFDGAPLRFERKEVGYQIVSGGATAFAKTKTKPIIGISVAR
jgi:hypothetical protein